MKNKTILTVILTCLVLIACKKNVAEDEAATKSTTSAESATVDETMPVDDANKEFVSVNLDVNNMTEADINQIKDIKNAGTGTECAVHTEVAAAAVRTDAVCRKDAKITLQDKERLLGILEKYEVSESEINKLK